MTANLEERIRSGSAKERPAYHDAIWDCVPMARHFCILGPLEIRHLGAPVPEPLHDERAGAKEYGDVLFVPASGDGTISKIGCGKVGSLHARVRRNGFHASGRFFYGLRRAKTDSELLPSIREYEASLLRNRVPVFPNGEGPTNVEVHDCKRARGRMEIDFWRSKTYGSKLFAPATPRNRSEHAGSNAL